ncbi:hypothetical protein APHAL10511_002292 [Amanita phalloides]|nr:hypothetical protein APHAL10511_002292 [Amanita phalloides]
MQLLSAVVLFVLTAVSIAQSIVIGAPQPSTTVTVGQSFNVQIQKPDTLTNSPEIALVIAIASCASSPCLTPQEGLGTLLYNGSFNPQFQQGSSLPPLQNFYVTVPNDFPTGAAQLNVANFELIGAELYPNLQLLDTAITVAR